MREIDALPASRGMVRDVNVNAVAQPARTA